MTTRHDRNSSTEWVWIRDYHNGSLGTGSFKRIPVEVNSQPAIYKHGVIVSGREVKRLLDKKIGGTLTSEDIRKVLFRVDSDKPEKGKRILYLIPRNESDPKTRYDARLSGVITDVQEVSSGLEKRADDSANESIFDEVLGLAPNELVDVEAAKRNRSYKKSR